MNKAVEQFNEFVRNHRPYLAKFPEGYLKVGMIGRFGKEHNIYVKQVINDTEMIIKEKWSTFYTVTKSISGRYEKGQCYEVTRSRQHEQLLWVCNISTKNIAQGKSITLNQVFEATSNKTYNSKTVLVIEPVDLSSYLGITASP